jgi:hypothetical protein
MRAPWYQSSSCLCEGGVRKKQRNKQGVCHILCGLAIYIIKKDLQAKEELYGNSNISPCKNIINLQKNHLKKTKILQDIVITL